MLHSIKDIDMKSLKTAKG